MTGSHLLARGEIFHQDYEILGVIGAGGMGAVYEARHLQTRRRLAIKVMLPTLINNDALRSRFRQEAYVTADLNSEHLVQIMDAGIDDSTGVPFMVMECLDGEDLGQVLTRRGRLNADEVVTLLGQAALLLDKAHDLGIVHRDLKPGNFFLTERDDGTPCIKVLDFGIAKLVAESGAAKTTGVVGTPLYMPQEQIAGDGSIGAAADTYAMVHIAFRMIVGRAYWDREGGAANIPQIYLQKSLEGDRQAASERAAELGVTLPTGFDAWFARATAKDPTYRYQRCGELIRDLAVVYGLAPGGPAEPLRGLENAPRGSLPSAAAITNGPSVPTAAAGPPPVPMTTTASAVAVAEHQSGQTSGRRWWRWAMAAVVLLAIGAFGAKQIVESPAIMTWLNPAAEVKPTSASSQPVVYNRAAVIKKARLIVQHLAGGEPANISPMMGVVARVAWPVAKWRKSWRVLEQQQGAFGTVVGTRFVRDDSKQVVFVELSFARGTVDLKLVFNEQELVTHAQFSSPLPHSSSSAGPQSSQDVPPSAPPSEQPPPEQPSPEQPSPEQPSPEQPVSQPPPPVGPPNTTPPPRASAIPGSVLEDFE